MISDTVMRRRCEVLLIGLLGRELALKWWDSKNLGFNEATPEEQWAVDPESVYNYLMHYAGT